MHISHPDNSSASRLCSKSP